LIERARDRASDRAPRGVDARRGRSSRGRAFVESSPRDARPARVVARTRPARVVARVAVVVARVASRRRRLFARTSRHR